MTFPASKLNAFIRLPLFVEMPLSVSGEVSAAAAAEIHTPPSHVRPHSVLEPRASSPADRREVRSHSPELRQKSEDDSLRGAATLPSNYRASDIELGSEKKKKKGFKGLFPSFRKKDKEKGSTSSDP